jgi:hypothetical protein
MKLSLSLNATAWWDVGGQKESQRGRRLDSRDHHEGKILGQILYVVLGIILSLTADAQDATNTYAQAILADSPVVYYQFAESPGATVAVDSSGNGNNGFYDNVSLGNLGATSRLSGAVGFNGSNSLVAVPPLGNAISLGGNGNDQFTIECWINPQSTAGGSIYSYDGWETGALNYLWDWTGPGLQFSLNGNATAETTVFNSNPPIPIGQWTCVAAVYDDGNVASNVVVYINGQPIGSNVFTMDVPVDFEPAEIGAWSSGGRFFEGLIGDFAIYTNALSAGRIQAHYATAAGVIVAITTQPQDAGAPLGGNATFTTAATVIGETASPSYQWQTNGVEVAGATNATYTTPILTLSDNGMRVQCVATAAVAIPTTTRDAILTIGSYVSYAKAVLADRPAVYYEFNESPGATVAVDSSGNGKNGAYTNVSLGNPGPTTLLGRAAGFNTAASFVAVPALASARSLGGVGNNQFTIEAWIHPTNYHTFEMVYGNYPWQDGAINYQLVDNDGIRFSMDGGSPAGDLSSPFFGPDQWAYVVITYDGSANEFRMEVNGQLFDDEFFACDARDFEPAEIGNWAGGGRQFSGLISSFAIYTNVLSPAEIQAHYAAALLRLAPPTLSVGMVGNQIALSWSANGFLLQESANLTNQAGWMNVPGGANSPVYGAIEQTSMFYRLIGQ